MNSIATLLLLGMVTGLIVLMASMAHTQQISDGWQITIYLPIDANDPTPNSTKNIRTIGPKIFDRTLCRDLLPAIREHFKGARKIDCE